MGDYNKNNFISRLFFNRL